MSCFGQGEEPQRTATCGSQIPVKTDRTCCFLGSKQSADQLWAKHELLRRTAGRDAPGAKMSKPQSVDLRVTATSDTREQYVEKDCEQPEKFHAVPIHLRPDLLVPCADLVNSEWQRSQAARVHSLQKSSPEFPVSLLLLQGHRETERLLGHARLSRVIGHSSSLFVESVVVSKAVRGRGYGRTLMEETERYAKSRGFKRLCLTTHDKQHFYAHIGYRLSTPVQNAGAMTAFVPMETLLRFSRMPSEDGNMLKQTQTKMNVLDLQESRDSEDASNAPPLSSIPPSPPLPLSPSIPPPPPPLRLSPSTPSSPPPLPPSIPPPPPPLSPSMPPPPPPPLPLSPSIPPLPQLAGQLGVQTLTETPYRDARGVPIYWMHKDI